VKNSIFIILLFVIPLHLLAEDKQFYNMSNNEIDSILVNISKEPLTITERIAIFSEYFLGTPYDFKCVGDGKDALLEKYPLVNFKRTNCMALCEHVLALAISDNWDNFFNNLMHIRYKDGIIGMKTRNHYTMADWLPQNSWILEDASAKVGGKYTKKMTRTISHQHFFKQKGITNMDYVQSDRTLTIPYIPLQHWNDIEEMLNQGDILSLLFADKDDIFSAHMVLAIKGDDGHIKIREATTREMKVVIDTPFEKWVKYKQKNNGSLYAGMAIIRVKKGLDIKGKIINPGNICKMKIN
jgi:hypothetical protein